eukprot:668436-Prorocentrum_minimum.AAC.1
MVFCCAGAAKPAPPAAPPPAEADKEKKEDGDKKVEEKKAEAPKKSTLNPFAKPFTVRIRTLEGWIHSLEGWIRASRGRVRIWQGGAFAPSRRGFVRPGDVSAYVRAPGGFGPRSYGTHSHDQRGWLGACVLVCWRRSGRDV